MDPQTKIKSQKDVFSFVLTKMTIWLNKMMRKNKNNKIIIITILINLTWTSSKTN